MKAADIIDAQFLLVYDGLHFGLIRPHQHRRPGVLVDEYRHLTLFVTIDGREAHTFPGLRDLRRLKWMVQGPRTIMR